VCAAAADRAVGDVVAGLLCEDSDREEQSQPEKQQAPVAPENLSSSQALSVDTEAGSQSAEGVEKTASTSFADRSH